MFFVGIERDGLDAVPVAPWEAVPGAPWEDVPSAP